MSQQQDAALSPGIQAHVDAFMDSVLAPSIRLLQPLSTEPPRSETSQLIVEWLQVNGLQAVATSLEAALDGLKHTPLVTDNMPDQSELETLLQRRRDDLAKERQCVSAIFESSLSLLSSFCGGRSLEPFVLPVLPDVNAPFTACASPGNAPQDLDGEPVGQSPAAESPRSHFSPAASAKGSTSSAQEQQQQLVPSAMNGKHKRKRSISSLLGSEEGELGEIVEVKMPHGNERHPHNIINQNPVCKRNGKGQHGARSVVQQQYYATHSSAYRVHETNVPLPTLQSSLDESSGTGTDTQRARLRYGAC